MTPGSSQIVLCGIARWVGYWDAASTGGTGMSPAHTAADMPHTDKHNLLLLLLCNAHCICQPVRHPILGPVSTHARRSVGFDFSKLLHPHPKTLTCDVARGAAADGPGALQGPRRVPRPAGRQHGGLGDPQNPCRSQAVHLGALHSWLQQIRWVEA